MARSCRLLTSWSLSSGAGSGVAAGAIGLRRALEAGGWNAEMVSPSYLSTGYFLVSLKRLLFNLAIRNDPRFKSDEPVVCFDFDGFLFGKEVRFASINGGLLGDIVRFESGLIRSALKVMALWEKRASHRADHVFTPSEYAKKTLCNLYDLPERKVTVMRHGIFYDEWVGKVKGASSATARPPTVLSVARLYRRKGIDLLLDAWPSVLAKIPDARLRIVGGGLEYGSLTSKASEIGLSGSVDFIGHLESNDELARHYAECDIFCLPSRHETFGLVFLEAMAAGKPVVALNSTAVPEVVRDGRDGLLANEGDRGGLSERIISLLNDPALRERMGRNGSERVRMEHDWLSVITPLTNWMGE